jgi:hypothetical protein
MDDISYTQIRKLLDGGISLLSPIQQAIVRDFFFREKPVTQKHFMGKHRMKKKRFDAERSTAISALRSWLISRRLTGMRDIE